MISPLNETRFLTAPSLRCEKRAQMAADKETAFDHNMFLFYPRPSASSAVLPVLVAVNGRVKTLCTFALKKKIFDA